MKERWYIHVSGYGGFDFEGTAAEAEEMRAHKARWEHGIAHMWRVAEGGHLVKVWGGDKLWPFPPTNDPARAEELLAIGLAEFHHRTRPCASGWAENDPLRADDAVTRAFSGHWIDDTGGDASAGVNGAWSALDDQSDGAGDGWGDEGNPDAYAAGAALAMALEDA